MENFKIVDIDTGATKPTEAPKIDADIKPSAKVGTKPLPGHDIVPIPMSRDQLETTRSAPGIYNIDEGEDD